MMAPNSLYLFEQRLKAGLLSVTDDVEERAFIEKHPFGGIHVIFGGDFYHLSAYNNALYSDTIYIYIYIDIYIHIYIDIYIHIYIYIFI